MIEKEPDYLSLKRITTGLGTCEIHGCEYGGFANPVPAVDRDEHGNIVGHHMYTVRACPMCDMERISKINTNKHLLADNNSAQATLQTDQEDYVSKFERKKKISLRRDTIVQYDYSDSLSVQNVENMKSWLVDYVGKQIKVKVVDTNKYVRQAKDKFMSDEEKQKFLRLKHEIEVADLVVVDSLADYEDREESEINKMMSSIKEKARLMVLTIPESDDRLGTLPSKLKYRMAQAQILSLSSTGGQR
ncbi:hypothetical protein [Lactococcus fujiensis]|nr:hypothetical protein [Lactococcus fujiensis]